MHNRQGQANHFTRYAPEHIQYGINRYQNESKQSEVRKAKRLNLESLS